MILSPICVALRSSWSACTKSYRNGALGFKNYYLCSEYRDQGLTRPKVLMVLPFRESALLVVQILSMLLMSEDEVRLIHICLTSLTRAKPKEKMEFPA